MKCVSCGASISSRERFCPYCGAENLRAKTRAAERERAERRYDAAYDAAAPALRRRTANKVLNRVLIVEAVLFALFLASIFAVFFLGDALPGLGHGGIGAELEALYREERFGELYALLDETDSFGEDYYEYSQMALLHYDYESFTVSRMEFFAERHGEPDEYTVSSLIGYMHDVLSPYIPAYPDFTERNAAILAEYQTEVHAFAAGTLGLTESEIAVLRQDYMTVDEEDALVAAVTERRYRDER